MAHPDQVRGYFPLPRLIDRTADSCHIPQAIENKGNKKIMASLIRFD